MTNSKQLLLNARLDNEEYLKANIYLNYYVIQERQITKKRIPSISTDYSNGFQIRST